MGRAGPPPPQPPPPCPTSAKTGIQGTGPAQAEPVLAPKGKGHGADCPQAAGPARAPSEQLPLVPPIHGGHRGPESPTRRATEPGAHAPRATGQLPRPGLGQAEPLASRRQGPPAPTSLPCQPPRQEGTVQCSRESAERFLLMAVFHQECQPALPPPPPKSSPSVLRQGKKTNPHQEQKHTKKPQTAPPKRSMAIEAGQQEPSHQPGHVAGSLGGWGAPQSPALHPAGTPPCGLLCGCLGDQKPTASHGGQPSSGPEPIRSYTSSTLGPPEAWGGAPTRCEAPAARVQGAHPQRGVDKTHQDTSA